MLSILVDISRLCPVINTSYAVSYIVINSVLGDPEARASRARVSGESAANPPRGMADVRRRAPRPRPAFATPPTWNRRVAGPIAHTKRALPDTFVKARAAEARGSLAEGLSEADPGRPKRFDSGFRKPPNIVRLHVCGTTPRRQGMCSRPALRAVCLAAPRVAGLWGA